MIPLKDEELLSLCCYTDYLFLTLVTISNIKLTSIFLQHFEWLSLTLTVCCTQSLIMAIVEHGDFTR